MENIIVLGSTGSVGKSTMAVLAEYADQFRIQALMAHSNVPEMIRQIRQFQPRKVMMTDVRAAEQLRRELEGSPVEIFHEVRMLQEWISAPEITQVVVATSGVIGLRPTLQALEAGKKVALANKETLVLAGHLVRQCGGEVRKGTLLPIDSEHIALLQCMRGESWSSVERMVLTASGGALRDIPLDQLDQVTPQQVLQHPVWSMGAAITVNSATMMNKGFEIIESYWLFGLDWDKLDAILHPQGVVHGLVHFCDGTWLAQMGPPDMRSAVLYALTAPERLPLSLAPIDWTQLELSFRPLDMARYPCFSLALEAGKAGGTCPMVLYTANAVLIEAFLQNRCSFSDIAIGVELALQRHVVQSNPSLEVLESTGEEVSVFLSEWLRSRSCR